MTPAGMQVETTAMWLPRGRSPAPSCPQSKNSQMHPRCPQVPPFGEVLETASERLKIYLSITYVDILILAPASVSSASAMALCCGPISRCPALAALRNQGRHSSH
jgi:hypothetical protein